MATFTICCRRFTLDYCCHEKKVPTYLCKMRRFRSSCAFGKYHSGISFPFIHFVVSNDSVSGQWRPWSDCADAQADLGLRLSAYAGRHVFAWHGPFYGFLSLWTQIAIGTSNICFIAVLWLSFTVMFHRWSVDHTGAEHIIVILSCIKIQGEVMIE